MDTKQQSLSVISDESRDDLRQAAMDAARAPDDPCDVCHGEAAYDGEWKFLCESCRDALDGAGLLRTRHRALTQGIIRLLADYGGQMPVAVRGWLRMLIMDEGLPELPGLAKLFWDTVTLNVMDDLNREGRAEV